MANTALDGKPYAGNPHIRIDEGDGASAKPRRSSLLYNESLLKHFIISAVAAVSLIGRVVAEENGPVTAKWLGNATSSVADAVNWECRDEAGNVMENALPTATTTVTIPSGSVLNVPEGTEGFKHAQVVAFDLGGDCDWRGQGAVQLAANGSFNLNGHTLTVRSGISGGMLRNATVLYKYYRFKVDAIRGDGGQTLCQISDLRLFRGEENVTTKYNVFTTGLPENQKAAFVDNDIGTKSCWPFYTDTAWVVLEYAEPILITRYEWYTGDDTQKFPGRNPKSWRFQGSNDGTTWVDLDVQENQMPTTVNKTLAYSWVCSEAETGGLRVDMGAADAVWALDSAVVLSRLTVASGTLKPMLGSTHGFGVTFETGARATIDVTEMTDGVLWTVQGGITLPDGAVASDVISLSDVRRPVKISDDGKRVMLRDEVASGYLELTENTDWTGSGVVTLAAGAHVNLREHELAVRDLTGAGEIINKVGFRYYRFKVDAIRGDGGQTLCQISELRLFRWAEDMTMKCNLFTSGLPVNQRAGLVDNDTNTKSCWAFDAGTAWAVFDYVEPMLITKYEWYTGDDTYKFPGRNPKSWRLQGSNDGTTWVDLDVQENQMTTTVNKALAWTGELQIDDEREGVLRFDVPANETSEPLATLRGSYTLAKDGAGQLVLHDLPDFAGNLQVKGGTVKMPVGLTLRGALELVAGTKISIDVADETQLVLVTAEGGVILPDGMDVSEFVVLGNTTKSVKLSADGKKIAIADNTPLTAMWIGDTREPQSFDVTLPENWCCTNAVGEHITAKVLPVETTTLVLPDGCMFCCPAGTELNYKSIVMGNVRLAADCDWRGLDFTKVTAGLIDLNGYDLRLSLAETPANAVTFTDTTSAGGTLHVEVPSGKTVNFGAYAFEGSLKVAKELSGVLELSETTTYAATGDFMVKDASSVKATGFMAFGNGAATIRALDCKSVIDLNGQTVVARTIYDNGTLENGASDAATVVLGRGDTDAALGFVPPANTKLKKEGAGTLTVNGTLGVDLELAGGKVVCHRPAFRHYRFVVLRAWGGVADAMQLSEFKLFDGEKDVTQLRSGFKYTGAEGSSCPAGETPENVVDGDLGNKYLDFRAGAGLYAANKGDVYVQFDYDQQQPITSYNWATGGDKPNDSPGNDGRDPTDWLLLGSDDQETWVTLDKRTGYSATAMRNAWVEPNGFSLTSRTFVGVTGEANTSLKIDGVDLAVNKPQIRVGSLDLANGGRFKIGQDLSQCKWFRFSIKKLEGGNGIMQISELALYDGDGNRVNQGLTAGDSATALEPGQVALANAGHSGQSGDVLFDGNTVTKWCVVDNQPSPGVPSTWEVVTMRLADGTARVASYNFATGDDTATHTDRNPIVWTLEASVDGVDWAVVDERTITQGPHANKAWYNGGNPYESNHVMAAAVTGSGEIVKAGMGDVTLQGSFAGEVGLRVEAGCFTVVPEMARCKWFRFSIKQLESGNIMQISELALYDGDGHRVNLGLTSGGAATALGPGQVAVYYGAGSGQSGEVLFDNDTATKLCVVNNQPSPATSSTWEVVTMRLADAAAPVASYNFTTGDDTASHAGRNPIVWTLEASADGVNWAVVDERAITQGPHANKVWYNSGTPYAVNGVIASPESSSFGKVSVAAGAELNLPPTIPVKGIEVDVSGAGRVNRLELASKGVIDIVNASVGDFRNSDVNYLLPLTIGELSGSTSGWRVRVNGVDLNGLRLRKVDNELYIRQNVFMLIFR